MVTGACCHAESATRTPQMQQTDEDNVEEISADSAGEPKTTASI